MWKVTFPDDEGEALGLSYWATLEEAQANKEWLAENYGIEAQIEFEPEDAPEGDPDWSEQAYSIYDGGKR